VLDSQTTLIMATLLFLVLPAMVWLILPGRTEPDVGMWCLASAMAGVGIVMLGLRGKVPVVVSFHLANTLIMGCFVCCVQSLRTSLGCAWTLWGWVARMLMVLLFYSVLYEWTSDAWRGVLYRLMLGGLSVYTAGWAWRLSRCMSSLNATTIAAAYLLVGLSLVAHSLWTANHLVDPSPFSNTWDASVISLVVLMMTVVTNLSYVGLVLDRLARVRLQAFEAEQAAAQSELLGSQLTRLDRRGRIAVMSSSLAHELSQPLTAATTYAQLAERVAEMPNGVGRTLPVIDQVEAAVGRTVRILQRIRCGQVSVPHFQKVNLQVVLDQALELMAPDFHQCPVTLTNDRSPSPVWCMGDELELSQVVVNLLRNALQAMAGQVERHLRVECSVLQGQAKLVVHDNGPGLSAEMIQRWGEPFKSTRDEGMGLGLAISREIVARHQGQLWLTNLPYGGMQAVVTLKKAEMGAA
jgi:signal transduction histidine kinase